MRRRERYEGLVWLSHFAGADPPHVATGATPPLSGVESMLSRLTHRGAYLVEMERDEDAYRVRLYPQRPKLPLGQPPVALSYSGCNLRSILAIALLELEMLRSLQNTWVARPKEVVRWVVSS